MSLILVTSDEIVVGEPMPWALYDREQKLLLAEGEIVRSAEHRDALLANGACHELAWQLPSGNADEDMFATEAARRESGVEQGVHDFTFDDMRLKAEDRLQLEPPSQLSRERFPVKVIGFLRGFSLLVTLPVTGDGRRLQLLESENVIMRLFTGQNAFGFASTVEKVSKYPFEYMHLSFPDRIQGIMIRKAPRIKARIIAAVRDEESEAAPQVPALISDISANGASLESKRPLGDKGDVLHLAFRVQLHSIEAYLSLKGVVRAVFGTDEEVAAGNVRHGIEFQELRPNDSIILQSMIYQQMIENPQQVV
jgi:hypothetical protein